MNVFRALFAVSIALLAVATRAQLATNSPFLPTPGSAAAALAAPAPIELRGMMVLGKVVQYYIYDIAKGKGSWVGPEEKGNSFVIKGQDLANSSVTVEQSGRTFNLLLREAKVASSGQAVTPVPLPIAQVAAVSPVSLEEQKRLDDVAAEVRKRREAREQLAAQPSPFVQPVARPTIQAPAQATAAQPQSGAAQNSTPRRGIKR